MTHEELHTPSPRIPSVKWGHIDGPMLMRANGGVHWLTWGQRLALRLGLATPVSIDARLRHAEAMAQRIRNLGGIHD